MRSVLTALASIPGFSTKRKLIIFASDDWGGVRIRSAEARKLLLEAGVEMDGNRFDRFDMLESNEDLEGLFEVLLSHKDHKGNHPVITAVANVANPDFEKIKATGFSEYHYEPFTETLKSYPNHNRVFELYQKGIALNIFTPELHGREHLQVNWWLQNLQAGNKIVLKAFENEFWHIPGKHLLHPHQRSLAAAYDMLDKTEVKEQKQIVADGARLFSELFGYNATLFIPPAMHYHKNLESAVWETGCKMIDVPRLRKMPIGSGRSALRFHYLGQKSSFGLRYFTRNAVFEPNMHPNDDGVSTCMKGIETAFKYRKPAIISNHRAAFVGGIDPANRDKGLKALDKLLKMILNRWPEAEFISAAGLFQIMTSKQ